MLGRLQGFGTALAPTFSLIMILSDVDWSEIRECEANICAWAKLFGRTRRTTWPLGSHTPGACLQQLTECAVMGIVVDKGSGWSEAYGVDPAR